jgi:hypothetical protein
MIPSFIAPAWVESTGHSPILKGNHPHLEAYVAHLTLLLVALLPTSNRLAPAQHPKFLPQAA